jgi:hypothetical protein
MKDLTPALADPGFGPRLCVFDPGFVFAVAFYANCIFINPPKNKTANPKQISRTNRIKS